MQTLSFTADPATVHDLNFLSKFSDRPRSAVIRLLVKSAAQHARLSKPEDNDDKHKTEVRDEQKS